MHHVTLLIFLIRPFFGHKIPLGKLSSKNKLIHLISFKRGISNLSDTAVTLEFFIPQFHCSSNQEKRF